MRALQQIIVRPVLPGQLLPLRELANNLRWVWHEPTRDLFSSIDREAWEESHHNPVRLLELVSPERLAELSTDAEFINQVAAIRADLDEYLTGPRWYQHQSFDLESVAYFSPEFGIAAALPQYSGGLGILAGDHLKAASDLGVPIIGVGLLYATGYFRQSLSADGWQLETYPDLHTHRRPLRQLTDQSGEKVKVELALPDGRALHAQVWVADVGRVPLLLLDSDVAENPADLRDVTDRLYGGDSQHRLRQELLLGVGGVRAVRRYTDIAGVAAPTVMHTNEGHAGFLGIERIRELMTGSALSYEQALEAVRAGTVFTTHTPVPAGIDRFQADMVDAHVRSVCGLDDATADQVRGLGAEPDGDGSIFNMAMMGLRLGGRANGVSMLHGEVSRGMFEALWPGFDVAEVPISSITNGVHSPTWVAPKLAALTNERLGDIDGPAVEKWLDKSVVSDAELWAMREDMRADLIAEVRRRVRESWIERGAAEVELGWTDQIFDPSVLTIGFARRVPTYKRLTLMLRDPERLKSLLLHPTRPVQLVIAGKSHPADNGGKSLIQEIVKFADEHDVRHRIAFLPNYDMAMAQNLYPGCDVWLNNPLRPLEACGTSGMKSALNGGLNLSVLDGWWDEWYDGRNGWAIPTADGVEDPFRRDDLEAGALYDLIENVVAPRFYDRTDGVPTKWLSDVRHTLATLGPKVQATRMVRDYVNSLYLPAHESASVMAVSDFAAARGLAEWSARVRQQWSQVRIIDSGFETPEQAGVGAEIAAWAEVSLAELSAQDVAVQFVVGPVDDHGEITAPQIVLMAPEQSSTSGTYRFAAHTTIKSAGPVGFTVRLVPTHPNLANPASLALSLTP